MAQKDSLFTLIKTLTPGEKRAFKLYANKYANKENTVVALFDFLSGLQSFRSEVVKDKFAKPRNLEKQLPVLKNQLLKLILNVLRIQSSKKKSKFKLLQQLANTDLLINRGLFDLAQKEILNAEKEATKIENYSMLVDVLNKKIEIARRLFPVDEFQERVRVIDKRRTEFEEVLQLENLVETAYNQILILYRRKGIADSKKTISEYHVLASKLGNRESEIQSSLKSQHYYYLFNIIYAFAFSNLKKASKLAIAHLNIIEGNIAFMHEYIDEYLKALNNAIVVHVNLKEFEKAKALVNKVELVANQKELINPFLLQRLFEIKYSNLLSIFVDQEDVNEGIALESAIRKGIKTYKNLGMSRDRHIRLSFGLALLYFKDDQWKKSLDWLDEIEKIERESGGNPTFISGYARLLQCLSHVHLKNFTLLESLVRSTKRFLLKHDRLLPVEAEIVRFLERVSQSPTQIMLHIDEAFERLNDVDTSETLKGFNSIKDMHTWLSHLKNMN